MGFPVFSTVPESDLFNAAAEAEAETEIDGEAETGVILLLCMSFLGRVEVLEVTETGSGVASSASCEVLTAKMFAALRENE